MAEKRVKVPTTSGPVDAVEVAVNESTERWTEVKLEDGSVIRLRASVVGAARLIDRYDPEGNPMYSLKINQIIVVASAPEHLHKGGTEGAAKGVQ